jgi:hypothetical protein
MANDVRVQIVSKVEVSEATSQVVNVRRKLEDHIITTDNYVVHHLTVAKDDADVEISLGGVASPIFLRIDTDQPVIAKLAGTDSTPITITKLFEMIGECTSLHLSGDGENNAEVYVVIAGA